MRGYSYSNICTNEIIVKWNHISIQGISLSTNTKINTPRFADDRSHNDIIIMHYFLMRHTKTGLYDWSTLCSPCVTDRLYTLYNVE